jgi:hypothetical protein
MVLEIILETLARTSSFSAVATGSGLVEFNDFSAEKIAEINNPMTFVNRTLLDFYEIDEPESGKKIKGGTIDFLIEHSNPMPKAVRAKKDGEIDWSMDLNSKKICSTISRKKNVSATKLLQTGFQITIVL